MIQLGICASFTLAMGLYVRATPPPDLRTVSASKVSATMAAHPFCYENIILLI